jgi:hypothetical protein
MTRIVHSGLLRRHIDLDAIVSVSDAYFMDHMGSGGWFVGFEIHFQLLDKPIKYVRGFRDDEQHYEMGEKTSGAFYLTFTDGTKDRAHSKANEGKTILAVHRLQQEVNELVKLWKNEPTRPVDVPTVLICTWCNKEQSQCKCDEPRAELPPQKEELLPTEGELHYQDWVDTNDLREHLQQLGKTLQGKYGPGAIETFVAPGGKSINWKWVPKS